MNVPMRRAAALRLYMYIQLKNVEKERTMQTAFKKSSRVQIMAWAKVVIDCSQIDPKIELS